MKKIIKKVLLSLLAIILAFIILWFGIFLWPYPQYRDNQKEVTLQDVTSGQIKVMSYNLRCYTPSDLGDKNWYNRAHYIIETIDKAQPSIIGFQEITVFQYNYLVECMPGFDSVITYRDNIPLFAEGCPIFYRTDLYDLIDKGSFWLSETPEVMSKDWDSFCYRICSYVILKDKATDKEFVVFNTHLDHVSDLARINGIKVVLDKIEEFGSIPALLIGDLNAEEDSETYLSATKVFDDTKYMTESTMTSCTYQNWGQSLDRNCIDYILSSKTGFNVEKYEVITDTFDGVYSSDHFPLMSTLTLE